MGSLEPNFRDEVAIVTGAASGIGLAVCRALAQAGARVHGFDVAPPESDPALAPSATGITFHAIDVCDASRVRDVVDGVVRTSGGVDHLVQAAGIVRDRALWKLEDDDWDRVIDVNLSGCFRVLQAVAPHMRQAERGHIVNITSINGMRGKFGQANYAASKAGLIGLTRAAARELGPRGITVNAVAAGMIETPMTRDLPDSVRERAVGETAVGRLGTTDDVVGAVLFLLSDAASHVTGEVVRVDGGQMS